MVFITQQANSDAEMVGLANVMLAHMFVLVCSFTKKVHIFK